MDRFQIEFLSIHILGLLFIHTIQSSPDGLSVSCMMDYNDGGAPAVYDSQECPQWALSPGSLLNQTLVNCQHATLKGHREYQEDRVACNLDMKLPMLKNNSLGFQEETVSMVAVFDGHCGEEASEMGSKLLFDYFNLHVVFLAYKRMGQYKVLIPLSLSDYKAIKLEILKEALLKTIFDIDLKFTKEAIKNDFPSGSTANTVLLYDGQILVANVGDSKALLLSEEILSDDSRVHLSATELTSDHHPDRKDEMARIKAAGGSVIIWGVPRVNGQLAMSRSIGDVALKRYGVIAEPEFTGWQVLTANDMYLVVASDGIFESLTPQDLADLILEWNLRFQGREVFKVPFEPKVESPTPQDMADMILEWNLRFEGSEESKLPFSYLSSSSLAECIVRAAYERSSHDNLSAIIVPLR